MAEPIGGLLGLPLFAAAQTWMVVRWGSCYARSSTDDVARALLLAIMLVAAVKCVTTFLPEAATMALMLALPFLSMGMLAVRLRDEADERPAEQWFTRASIPSFGRIVAAMAVPSGCLGRVHLPAHSTTTRSAKVGRRGRTLGGVSARMYQALPWRLLGVMATMSQMEHPHSQGSESADPWQRAADAFVAWREEEAPAAPLVEVMTPVLWQVARAYDLNEDQARDALQNVWLAMVRSRETIVDPQAIGAWLITATRREAWHLRTAARKVEQRQAPVRPEVEIEHYLPAHRAAEDEALERSEARRLWHALATLPERCRRLLRVIAFSDRPNYAALAQDLHMPVGSIGPTRGRCLGKLRSAMTSRATTSTSTPPNPARSR